MTDPRAEQQKTPQESANSLPGMLLLEASAKLEAEHWENLEYSCLSFAS